MKSLRNGNLPCQSNPSRVFLENSISQMPEEILLLGQSGFHLWSDAIGSVPGSTLSPEGREDSGAASSHHLFQGKPTQRRMCWCWKHISSCTDPQNCESATPHPQALCFLQGNSGILQWWKDSLIILHTKKTVIVFHFTWKLMDLGIPDADAQNPLWSLSGDLSSLGCLWCTPVSAEVICELLHTKSRFLREAVRAHTHTPTPTQTPSTPCPAPCLQVLLQRAVTWGGTSHLTGYGGLGRKGKAGFAPERGIALQSCARCDPCPLIPGSWERAVGAAGLYALLRQTQAASETDMPMEVAISTDLTGAPYSSWMQWFSHRTGSPTCMSRACPLCQALGLPYWTFYFGQKGMLTETVSAGIKKK